MSIIFWSSHPEFASMSMSSAHVGAATLICSQMTAQTTFCYAVQYCIVVAFRDRPFNLKGGGRGLWFFVSFRKKISDNTRVKFFFCRVKRENFFQYSSLGYMTKTLSQIIFFPPPKSEYFLQQHWESEYFFRKKP